MGFRRKASEYKIERWEVTAGGGGDPTALRAHVSGRPTGILAAIAGALGMGRSLDLRLTGEAVMLETSSLAQAGRTNIPLRSLSSISAGRTRPVVLPVILALLGLATFVNGLSADDGGGSSRSFEGGDGGGGGGAAALIFGLALLGLAVFLYVKGGRMSVTVTETGGDSLGFLFRPTTVGGVVVDEQAAFALCDLATALALGHDAPPPQRVPEHADVGSSPAMGGSPMDHTGGNGDGGTPPGWYPDPGDPSGQRYWSGTEWTDQTMPLEHAGPA